MARSVSEIEAALRMMMQGHTHAAIAKEIFNEDTARPVTSIWLSFRKRMADITDSGALKAKLDDRGFTLSLFEINQLRALNAQPIDRRFVAKALPVRSSSALKAPEDSVKAPPHSLEFSHEWLLREGVPYGKTEENGCSQPVGTVQGNVCGERIEASRFKRGLTTCQACNDVVRTPGSTAKTGNDGSSYDLSVG